MLKLIFLLQLLLLACGASALSGCGENWGRRAGDASPRLTGIDLAGNRVDTSQYRGKVMVLYFWHGSCCVDKLQPLDRMYAKLKDKSLVVVAIDGLDTRKDIAAVAQNYSLKLPLWYDEGSKGQKSFGVIGYPTYLVIDKNGIIRKKILGNIEPEQLEKLVAPYLI